MFEMERITASLRSAVAEIDADRVSGRDALRLVRAAAELERLAATAKALYARRCVRTTVWADDPASRVPAVSPAEWLADVSGSHVGVARDALAVAKDLHPGSATDRALRDGSLSMAAAREVTAAAAVGGQAAERRVLRKAEREGLRAAKTEAARVLATAADADERAERVHHQRSRRRWVSRDQVWHLHLQGPVALGAEVEACLAPFDDAAWDAAARQPRDGRDTPEAIAFDGFVAMARCARDGARPHGAGHPTPPSGPTTERATPRGRARTRDHVVVHVDAAALLNGTVDDGERCEIPGLGPVPVAHARRILGDSILSILVEHGTDVSTFARPGRRVTAALAHLLDARDATCTITGCGRAARLEGDHTTPVSEGGDSDAHNLRGLCRQHHRRKTDGWILTDHPDGSRTLAPPPGAREAVAA